MEKEYVKYTIVDILDAPLIECLVIDKDSDDILYKGDSSYEANKAYSAALKNELKPKYFKKTTRLVPEKERPTNLKGDKVLSLYRDLITRLPERIQSIYANTIAGKKILAETIELAQHFHPEYFKVK